MAKTENKEEIEQTKRVGDFPAAMPDDEPFEDVFEKAAKKDALEQDELTEFEEDEETGEVRASIRGLNINASSTYPGRNADLIANDMRIPTELDLARRAKAAGSQVPARAFAAGLGEEAGAEELKSGDTVKDEDDGA